MNPDVFVGVTTEQNTANSEVALGQRLQAARKKAGQTQQELCQRAGLSYSTLAKIERGAIKSPSIFTIQSIASALNTSLNELMGDSSGGQSTPKKRSKSGVRFVYFDVNGCLVRFFHRAFTKLAEETGTQADTIEATFWHFNDSVCRGEMPLNEFERIFAERTGVPSVDWTRLYLDAVEPIAEVQQMLPWVAENYLTGLLTNIMPGFLTAMREHQLLPSVNFDVIIDSSEVGVIKPEERMYQIAQEKSGVDAHEILLVDDARPNLMAAERMGWHVLWFDDYRPSDSVTRIREILEPQQ